MGHADLIVIPSIGAASYRGVIYRPQGVIWPDGVDKVEWFERHQAGVIHFTDGSAERFTDRGILAPLEIAIGIEREKMVKESRGLLKRMGRWLKN